MKEYGGLPGFMRKFRANAESFLREFQSKFGSSAMGDARPPPRPRPRPRLTAPLARTTGRNFQPSYALKWLS
eukprot:6063795-Prymnesium_polylepis.1